MSSTLTRFRLFNTIQSLFARSKLLAPLGYLFSARFLAAAAAFGSTVLVGRLLSPSAFAHFMFLFLLMNLVENLVGPALDTSLVRFAASHITPEKDGSLPYFRAVFWVKLWVACLIIVAGVVLAPVIHARFLSDDSTCSVSYLAVTVAFAGGAIMMLWRFAQAYFQAHERFGKYANIEFMSAFFRLGCVAVLWLIGVKSILLYLCAYVAAPLVLCIVAWVQLPKGLLDKVHKRHGILKEFFRFAMWVVIASIFSTMAQRVDAFLLPWFSAPITERGCYFAALVLANLGELVVYTLFSILLPKACQLKSSAERIAFLKRHSVTCVALAIPICLVLPCTKILTLVTFGSKYLMTTQFFMILMVGIIVTLISTPSGALVYAMGHSYVIALMEILKFTFILLIGYSVLRLDSVDKTHAMAWIVSMVKMTASLSTFAIAWYLLLRERRQSQDNLIVPPDVTSLAG